MRQFNENRNSDNLRAVTTSFIGLGANLPGPDGASPLQTCQRAAVRLAQLPGARMAGLSRWFASAPIPVSDQPSYVNGIAMLTFQERVDPAVLLAWIMAIETECGRRRGVPNAARTLDLDLIAMEGPDGPVIRSAPDPILPHPRAHLRAFVLAPMADIAPDWRHPVLNRSVQDLLRDVADQDVRPL